VITPEIFESTYGFINEVAFASIVGTFVMASFFTSKMTRQINVLATLVLLVFVGANITVLTMAEFSTTQALVEQVTVDLGIFIAVVALLVYWHWLRIRYWPTEIDLLEQELNSEDDSA